MFFNRRHFTLANLRWRLCGAALDAVQNLMVEYINKGFLKSPVTVTVALPPESDSDTSSPAPAKIMPQKLCTTFNTQNNIRIPISCPQKHLGMYLFFLKFAQFYLKLQGHVGGQNILQGHRPALGAGGCLIKSRCCHETNRNT
jgi:hypothetical protein